MFVLASTAREYERRAIAAEKAAAEANAARRTVGRALSEKVAECNALSAKLKPFLDRQAKAKLNLRQFRTAPEPGRLPPIN